MFTSQDSSPLSLTQKRLITSASLQIGVRGDSQPLVLHRKTFYDEPHDKLIIVSVSIECILNRKKSSVQMCMVDADTFRLNILEPETKNSMDFDLRIDKCFLEEEILGGVNLKNVNHLKKMARVLVEERAIIKRVNQQSVEEGDNAASAAPPLYTVEINLSQINPLDVNESVAQKEAPPNAPSQDNTRKPLVQEEQ